MQTIGGEIAEAHPELGLLEHIFFVTIMQVGSKYIAVPQTIPDYKVALFIHGTDIVANKHNAKVFALVQDQDGVVREINEGPEQSAVPENPWLAAFIRGYQERARKR